MSSLLLISADALIIVLAAFAFAILYKKTRFHDIPYMKRQIIYGIVFGLLAVVGNEFGVPYEDVQLNVRDAAVLTTGLLFGAPSAIIAGLIGGIERYFCVYWGVSAYTQIACSLSTISAGVFAAIVRKTSFENRRPTWPIALFTGVVVEVFHMAMILATNISTIDKATMVVTKISTIMIVVNSAAVGLSVLLVTIYLEQEEKRNIFKDSLKDLAEKRKALAKLVTGNTRISEAIQRWLLIPLIIGLFITIGIYGRFLDRSLESQAETLLIQTIDDVKTDIGQMLREKNAGRIDIDYQIRLETANRHVLEEGFVAVTDSVGNIVSAPTNIHYDTTALMGIDINKCQSYKIYSAHFNDRDYKFVQSHFSTYHIVTFLPNEEVFKDKKISQFTVAFSEIIVFGMLFYMIYSIIKSFVVKPIRRINNLLDKIKSGNLDVEFDVRDAKEYSKLSDSLNGTVDSLKHLIGEAEARIDAELEMAKNIQESALPHKFPHSPYYEIYATMKTAKEVGGDFYDYYGNQKSVNFMVADVSGKGIPAALFMMRSKSTIHALAESGYEVQEVFTQANNYLCEGNEGDMFVTALQGNLNFENGLLEYANAGHNPPAVKLSGNDFKFGNVKPGFVLAGMEGIKYKKQTLQLNPGDIIFAYTDGVTEATNANNELFGEERLLRSLNSCKYDNMKELCNQVMEDVLEFTGDDVEQFDDITILAVKYYGPINS